LKVNNKEQPRIDFSTLGCIFLFSIEFIFFFFQIVKILEIEPKLCCCSKNWFSPNFKNGERGDYQYVGKVDEARDTQMPCQQYIFFTDFSGSKIGINDIFRRNLKFMKFQSLPSQNTKLEMSSPKVSWL